MEQTKILLFDMLTKVVFANSKFKHLVLRQLSSGQGNWILGICNISFHILLSVTYMVSPLEVFVITNGSGLEWVQTRGHFLQISGDSIPQTSTFPV